MTDRPDGPEPVGDIIERILGPQEGCGASFGEICQWAPTGECDICRGRRDHDQYVENLAGAIAGALPEGVDPATVWVVSQKETFPVDSSLVVEDQEIPFELYKGPSK